MVKCAPYSTVKERAGKLFVGNTCENLSTLEQVLKEMKLIQGR